MFGVNQMFDFCKLLYSTGTNIDEYMQYGDSVLTKEGYREITGHEYVAAFNK